jgi:ABC-type polysaccharide/polyol phosphate export permease
MSVQADHSARWVENAAPTGRWPSLRLDEIWRHRELIYFFALRDLKVRYKQAFLGVAWAGVQPLIGALAFTILFNRLTEVDLDGRSYYAFALVGFSVWTYFSSAVTHGSHGVLYNAELLTKVALRPIVPPVAAMLPGLIDLTVGLAIATGVALATGDGVGIGAVALGLPSGLALLIASALAPAWYLGASIVRYRDIAVVVVFGLQVLLFASPVAYPPELYPGAWHTAAYASPLTGALGLLRGALTGAPFPSGARLALSTLAAVVLLGVGLFHFRRNEREFADII